MGGGAEGGVGRCVAERCAEGEPEGFGEVAAWGGSVEGGGVDSVGGGCERWGVSALAFGGCCGGRCRW